MNIWRALDLRSISGRPIEGRLVALYMRSRTPCAGYRSEEYRIGRFARSGPGTKLWWKDTGTVDLASMKKRYEIWWSYIDECRIGGNV